MPAAQASPASRASFLTARSQSRRGGAGCVSPCSRRRRRELTACAREPLPSDHAAARILLATSQRCRGNMITSVESQRRPRLERRSMVPAPVVRFRGHELHEGRHCAVMASRLLGNDGWRGVRSHPCSKPDDLRQATLASRIERSPSIPRASSTVATLPPSSRMMRTPFSTSSRLPLHFTPRSR